MVVVAAASKWKGVRYIVLDFRLPLTAILDALDMQFTLSVKQQQMWWARMGMYPEAPTTGCPDINFLGFPVFKHRLR
jgi:hypothetical protein